METALTIRTAADLVPVSQFAAGLKIIGQEDRNRAMEAVQNIRSFVRINREPMDLECDERFRAHKEATARRAEFLRVPTEAEKTLLEKVRKYDEAEKAAREAEARRLQAIEDEKRRREQERLDALARAQREKEAAARRAEEEARRKAQEATNEAERVKAQAEAEKARKAAEAASAKAHAREEAAAEVLPAPVITLPPVEKAAGESAVKVWKYEITDAAAVPRDYMMVDTVKLGAVVRATKGTLAIAGVRIYSETGIRMRG